MPVSFRHERIDDDPPCSDLCFLQPADLTGDGASDFVVGGHGPHGGEHPPDERNVFWYENPGDGRGEWTRHDLDEEPNLRLSVGSTLHDVDGDGRLDLISGQNIGDTDVFWWEQPPDPRDPWERRLVSDAFQKYHDFAVGDVDDDGDPELVGLSQDAETVFYYDLPRDPTVEPWPEANCHVVDDDIRVEGVAVVDLDGDGRTEIVAGTSVYHRRGPDDWERERIAEGWDDNRVAVADLDGDGDLEVVFSEGDSPAIGSHMGRVAWFERADDGWNGRFLHEDLMNPHTLQVADVTGSGTLDVLVAEMGLDGYENPEIILFENDGEANFEPRVLGRGVATHEARLVDVTGNGRLDLLGKNYGPEREKCHVDVWYNEPA
jgi:hypothetical protein